MNKKQFDIMKELGFNPSRLKMDESEDVYFEVYDQDNNLTGRYYLDKFTILSDLSMYNIIPVLGDNYLLYDESKIFRICDGHLKEIVDAKDVIKDEANIQRGISLTTARCLANKILECKSVEDIEDCFRKDYTLNIESTIAVISELKDRLNRALSFTKDVDLISDQRKVEVMKKKFEDIVEQVDYLKKEIDYCQKEYFD